jgi:uncharacterized protein (TIGR02452 family)
LLPPELHLPFSSLNRAGRVEVSAKSAFSACRRLAQGGRWVAILDFASPTKPGGGFLNSKQTQEEALARLVCLNHLSDIEKWTTAGKQTIATFIMTI